MTIHLHSMPPRYNYYISNYYCMSEGLIYLIHYKLSLYLSHDMKIFDNFGHREEDTEETCQPPVQNPIA